MVDRLRFTQIVTGTWSGERGNNNHSLYGLSEDGEVYRFYTGENCWRKLPMRVGPDVGYDQRTGPQSQQNRKEPF